MTNVPYVKKYENGLLTNPINGQYTSPFENRKQRRFKPSRTHSNKKGVQIVITKIGRGLFAKSERIIQRFKNKTVVTYKIS